MVKFFGENIFEIRNILLVHGEDVRELAENKVLKVLFYFFSDYFKKIMILPG